MSLINKAFYVSSILCFNVLVCSVPVSNEANIQRLAAEVEEKAFAHVQLADWIETCSHYRKLLLGGSLTMFAYSYKYNKSLHSGCPVSTIIASLAGVFWSFILSVIIDKMATHDKICYEKPVLEAFADMTKELEAHITIHKPDELAKITERNMLHQNVLIHEIESRIEERMKNPNRNISDVYKASNLYEVTKWLRFCQQQVINRSFQLQKC